MLRRRESLCSAVRELLLTGKMDQANLVPVIHYGVNLVSETLLTE